MKELKAKELYEGLEDPEAADEIVAVLTDIAGRQQKNLQKDKNRGCPSGPPLFIRESVFVQVSNRRLLTQ